MFRFVQIHVVRMGRRLRDVFVFALLTLNEPFASMRARVALFPLAKLVVLSLKLGRVLHPQWIDAFAKAQLACRCPI